MLINRKLVILTGAEGFIGKNLLNQLIKQSNIEIIGNDLKKQTIFSDNYKYIQGDLSSNNVLRSIFEEISLFESYLVIHLAAQTSAQISMERPILDISYNLGALINLIEFISFLEKKPKLFIFSSSMAVYGDSKLSKNGFDEKQYLSPCSVYGHTKLIGEKLVKLSNINYLNLRLFNIYGPLQDLSNTKQGMISIYLDSLIRDNIIYIKGDLERTRDQVFVDDLVQFLIKLIIDLEKYEEQKFKNKTYNFSTGQSISVYELTEIMINIYYLKTGIKGVKKLLDPTKGDMNKSFGNNQRLKRSFDFVSFTPLKKGLSCMMNWALENYK